MNREPARGKVRGNGRASTEAVQREMGSGGAGTLTQLVPGPAPGDPVETTVS